MPTHEACGAGVGALGPQGALHHAAWKGSDDFVRLLLDAGASINALTVRGQNPLHFATGKRRDTTLALLCAWRRATAMPCECPRLARDRHRWNARRRPAKAGSGQLRRHCPVCNRALSAPGPVPAGHSRLTAHAVPRVTTIKAETPLDLARQFRCTEASVAAVAGLEPLSRDVERIDFRDPGLTCRPARRRVMRRFGTVIVACPLGGVARTGPSPREELVDAAHDRCRLLAAALFADAEADEEEDGANGGGDPSPAHASRLAPYTSPRPGGTPASLVADIVASPLWHAAAAGTLTAAAVADPPPGLVHRVRLLRASLRAPSADGMRRAVDEAFDARAAEASGGVPAVLAALLVAASSFRPLAGTAGEDVTSKGAAAFRKSLSRLACAAAKRRLPPRPGAARTNAAAWLPLLLLCDGFATLACLQAMRPAPVASALEGAALEGVRASMALDPGPGLCRVCTAAVVDPRAEDERGVPALRRAAEKGEGKALWTWALAWACGSATPSRRPDSAALGRALAVVCAAARETCTAGADRAVYAGHNALLATYAAAPLATRGAVDAAVARHEVRQLVRKGLWQEAAETGARSPGVAAWGRAALQSGDMVPDPGTAAAGGSGGGGGGGGGTEGACCAWDVALREWTDREATAAAQWHAAGMVAAAEAPVEVTALLPADCTLAPHLAPRGPVRVYWAGSPPAVREAVRHLAALPRGPPIGVDLEWRAAGPAALVQVACEDEVWLLDGTVLSAEAPCPLARDAGDGDSGEAVTVGMALAKALLCREGPLLAFAARQDVLRLRTLAGPAARALPWSRVLDLQRHIQHCTGEKRHSSLVAAAARFAGIELDKGEQVSDWERRPLPASQLAYAATDAWVLLPLHVAVR